MQFEEGLEIQCFQQKLYQKNLFKLSEIKSKINTFVTTFWKTNIYADCKENISF